jgi:type VI secretion system secreted protein Hcp
MAILVKLAGLENVADCELEGYKGKGWFIADSFGFGVERELKESGEKGGTEDLNIGVGELQECSISKSLDATSTLLSQYAINGNSLGTAEIAFVEVAGGGVTGKPFCYLFYKLQRCFVKSWSTSGDADDRPTEEITFLYNKIAFNYASTPDGKNFKPCQPMCWDNVRNVADWPHQIGFKPDKGGFA